MLTHEEKPFTINGIKYSIHCIHMHPLKANVERATNIHYHYHEYIEFLYSLSTNATCWINGKPFSFQDGDFVMINSGEPHELIFYAESDYIVLKFSPGIIYSNEQSIFEYKYLLPFIIGNDHQKLFHCKSLEGSGVRECMMEIMQEWDNRNHAYELMIRSDILKIYAWIMRYWHSNNALTLNGKLEISDSMKKALTFINENFDSATEKETAKFSNLSYNHFSSSFKKITGQSFIKYVNSLKIKKAERLLMTSDQSITDIALNCGFSSISHFIAKFKSAKGITPLQYKKIIFKTTNSPIA